MTTSTANPDMSAPAGPVPTGPAAAPVSQVPPVPAAVSDSPPQLGALSGSDHEQSKVATSPPG